MAYEVVYTDGIEKDFKDLNLDENDVISLDNRLKVIAQHPNPLLLTDRVLNTHVRKIPFNNKLRVFLHIANETIYCLAVRHHNNCYKKQELNKILTLYKRLVLVEEK